MSGSGGPRRVLRSVLITYRGRTVLSMSHGMATWEIIARASGREYHDYVREHVFRAAAMGNADYYTLPQLCEDRRIAHGYYRPPEAAGRADNPDGQIFAPGAFAACAQLERFAHALWEGIPGLARNLIVEKD